MNKIKYLGTGLLAASLLLTACGQKEEKQTSSDQEKTEHQSEEQSTHENHQKSEENNEKHLGSKASESKHNAFSHLNPNSDEYLARVWLAALPSYRSANPADISISHIDLSGKIMYGPGSIRFGQGIQSLSGSPTAAGHVVYKNNGDGTITIYPVPSHFQDHRWQEEDYSREESQRIMNSGEVVPLYDGNEEAVRLVESYIGATPPGIDEDDEESEETVTRENVIDKVEEYEGHQLDTSRYTFKEPERRDDGGWGFSILDKQGNLVGSYIIDSDGDVTKYDEHGDEV
ncbi:hypothetical protein [Staphylococcus simulans]|uniref:hypothetical protein n=1 Tax=Staphylococcus simulans TaxID=1286 RepID=UPI000D0259EB|nr:hypothetical protein [Staphylococcus simulans]PTJ01180.1 hypothetical protein BU047_11715 [Staphylococcus simulans]PTJ18604.1 hypothetical protein BU037_02125 [Staphylococcus simulans]PTJ45422.1 hypothetical protein BU014_11185 [Staphylococcus simulans]PTJ86883.1 hypothetical protein BU051_03530 [Staphylococcus simulans]